MSTDNHAPSLPPQPDPDCIRCGSPKSVHTLVNYADGPAVGLSVLLCPTAVFEEVPKPQSLPIRAHGPVSERFMRHHYGAKK